MNKEPGKKVSLESVRSHPRQEQLFPFSSDVEINILADDMKARGLQHPIEVLPDNTIVCGHNRVRAAQQLGWEEIDVVIRHDLADKTDLEIEQHLIADNVMRRQLRPMELARLAFRLRAYERGGEYEGLDDESQDDVYRYTRDRIGHTLGISGRQVSRLIAILDTPIEVQQACDNGELSINTAARVARLPSIVHEEIVRDILAGKKPNDVVKKHLQTRRPLKDDEVVYKKLVSAISEAMEKFENGFDDLRAVDLVNGVDPVVTLRTCVPFMEDLATHVEQRTAEIDDELERKMETIVELLGNVLPVE